VPLFTYRHLKPCSLLLFMAGWFLLGILIAWFWPLDTTSLGAAGFWKLALAAFLGIFFRGLRRKLFFAKSISVHQAVSFEIVVQLARLVSPLLPHRALEHVFIIKETGFSPEQLNAWARARMATAKLFFLLALAVFSWAAAIPIGIAVTTAVGLWMLFTSRGKVSRKDTRTVLGGLLIWLVEGSAFAWAFAGELPVEKAAAIYILFTFAFDFSPVPFGIGVVELAAFAAWPHQILWALIVFHVLRLLPILVLATIYLARHKFAILDFFDIGIITAIEHTRRPRGGWPFIPESPRDGAPFVSIIIPAYNEEKRLPKFLESVFSYCKAHPDLTFEILVVDDGSTDATAELTLAATADDPRVRLLCQCPNQGKGAAVRRGVMEAAGHYILYADADGATPIDELNKLLLYAQDNTEIVIGSRKIASHDVIRERQGLRAMLGGLFYRLVNCLAVPGIRDTQCGFKLLRRDVARLIFERMLQCGWAFDVEMLYLAQMLGFSIKEVPINWHEVDGSKINPIKDSLKMLLAVFKIRSSQGGFLKHG